MRKEDVMVYGYVYPEQKVYLLHYRHFEMLNTLQLA